MTTQADIGAYEGRRASLARRGIVIPDRYGKGPVGHRGGLVDTSDLDPVSSLDDLAELQDRFAEAEVDEIVAFANAPEPKAPTVDDILAESDRWLAEGEKHRH